MSEDEIKEYDVHCGGCDLYMGLGECALPPGCCVLADAECAPELDVEVPDAQAEGRETL